MKRTIFGLVAVMLALGLVLAGCAVPFDSISKTGGARAAAATPTDISWVDGFGFHCNDCKGNGATSVIDLRDGKNIIVAKGNQKDVFGVPKTYPIPLKRVGNTTTWDLVTDNIECATCGRIDWVTFSNNNGVINGKNIQAQHSGTPRYKKFDFNITVYHRVAVTGDYLYFETGETFSSADEWIIEELNKVNGFTFLNLYLAALRSKDPADMALVKGYVCSGVTKTSDVDKFNLDIIGKDENTKAKISPLLKGNYAITFWYEPLTDYTFVPYLYYGTAVWPNPPNGIGVGVDIDQNSPLLEDLHARHALAIAEMGASVRVGEYLKGDVHQTGWLLTSVYNDQPDWVKEFWADWGAQYRAVYLALGGVSVDP